MNRKKGLLLNPPSPKGLIFRDYYCSFSSKGSYYWPPIDLLVLSGLLRESCNVEVLDATVTRLSYEETRKKILKSDCDTIIFLAGTAARAYDIGFIAALKKEKSFTAIASGGFLLSSAPEVLKAQPALDAVILNFTTSSILDYLAGKREVLPDIVFRDGDRILGGPARYAGVHDSFLYGIPQHELFPLAAYRTPVAQRYPMTCVITSFGCPFRCSFCIGSILDYRLRDLENIVAEIRALSSLGVKEIFFPDYTFTASKRQVLALCERMVAEKFDLTWSCNMHVATVDQAMLEAMRGAGCHTVQVGVENASDEILKRYSKSAQVEEMRRAFRLCRETGMKTLGYFIIGLPGDTKDSILDTIRLAKELDPDYASFTVATPDIGTKLWEESIEKGWIFPGDNQFDSTGAPLLPVEGLTSLQVKRLRNRADLEFYLRPRYLFRALGQIKSVRGGRELFKNGFWVLKSALMR